MCSKNAHTAFLLCETELKTLERETSEESYFPRTDDDDIKNFLGFALVEVKQTEAMIRKTNQKIV